MWLWVSRSSLLRIVLSVFEPELDTELATFRGFGGEPTELARPDFKFWNPLVH